MARPTRAGSPEGAVALPPTTRPACRPEARGSRPDGGELARACARGGAAVVLGATLALGGGALAGCDDPVDPKRPSLSAPDLAPREAPPPAEPDIDAVEGALATARVGPGFTPDPLVREGVTGGGRLDASPVGDGCSGWIGSRPDLVVDAARPFAELSVMVASRAETTLLVLGPDGRPRCAGGRGALPLVRGDFDAGRHRVWVGTAERGAAAPFVLALSELDDAQPAALLH